MEERVNLSSADALKLVMSKILSFGRSKGLTLKVLNKSIELFQIGKAAQILLFLMLLH